MGTICGTAGCYVQRQENFGLVCCIPLDSKNAALISEAIECSKTEWEFDSLQEKQVEAIVAFVNGIHLR